MLAEVPGIGSSARYPERPSRLPVEVPADLPSADQPIRRGAHIPPKSPRAAERQIVNAAELPDVRAVVIGRLLHRLRVLRVQEVVLFHRPSSAELLLRLLGIRSGGGTRRRR